MTDNLTERLEALSVPDLKKLRERTPECPWCGRGVDVWGDTCDHRCYDAWVQKILPRREAIGGDEWTAKTLDFRPNPESQQLWTRPQSR